MALVGDHPPRQKAPVLTSSSRAELAEVRRETAALITDLRDVRSELQGLLEAGVEAQKTRYEHQVRVTETALTRALETHDHAGVVAAVVALLNGHDEMMRDWHTHSMES